MEPPSLWYVYAESSSVMFFSFSVCYVRLTEQIRFYFKTTVVVYWALSAAKTRVTLHSVLCLNASGVDTDGALLLLC